MYVMSLRPVTHSWISFPKSALPESYYCPGGDISESCQGLGLDAKREAWTLEKTYLIMGCYASNGKDFSGRKQ